MMQKLCVAATIVGLLCGYAVLVYALVYAVMSIDHFYFLRLAM